MTPESIEMHLELIHQRLRDMRERQAIPRDVFLSDAGFQGTISYWLLEVIQSCIQVGTQILVLRNYPSARSYKDVFSQLHRHGLIPLQLRDRMIDLAGLRNLLVHEYWQVDLNKLYDALQNRLTDVEEFAQIAFGILVEGSSDAEPQS